MKTIKRATAVALAAIMLTTAPAHAGPWDFHDGKSEMDDSPYVVVYTKAMHEIDDVLGYDKVRPELRIQCVENKTSIWVNWQRFITTGGIDDRTRVRFRLDDKTAQKDDWVVATNHEATGLVSGQAIAFIQRLLTANHLTVETQPYGEGAITVKFDVANLSNQLHRVQKACHWSTDSTSRKKKPEKTIDQVISDVINKP